MNKLITKARSGVTLVELLVVILIVTILSVSMLPLLQPFVVEAQYAAEAIPVIGNLRTKIGIYQYDKGKLPCLSLDTQVYKDDDGKDQTTLTPLVETWAPVATDKGSQAIGDAATVDYFAAAFASFPSTKPPLTGVEALGLTTVNKDGKSTRTTSSGTKDLKNHLQTLCDIDYQDLKGKRSKPNHYQYLVMLNGSDYAYFTGCFGDGNGLKKGTGYAVCEILKDGHKYVGTWKRYKPVSDDQICFTSNTDTPDNNTKTYGCYVPTSAEIAQAKDADGQLDIIGTMANFDWEF